MYADILNEEPVILDPGNHFIPYNLFENREVWTRVPNGGAARDYFIRINDYKPWFAIFMKATGCWYSAYYPIAPMRRGTKFSVPITFCNDIEPIISVIWTHETLGLAKEILEEIAFYRAGI